MNKMQSMDYLLNAVFKHDRLKAFSTPEDRFKDQRNEVLSGVCAFSFVIQL
uniref:Uncharacterized protein n=1 Tax=Arundo donax TaxID=35708 RepID=A0A0A9ABG0_ARUDO